MSLLALESHSSINSCSWVCFTSTAAITFEPQHQTNFRLA
jgi:hypothetical protein